MAMFAESRRLILATALSAAACAAHAQVAKAKDQAQAGAVADGVTSFVGIAAGAPVNPLLPVAGLAFKAVTLQHAESLPETERPRAYAMAAAGWQGSAAGNTCATVSILSGGSFLPMCLVVGAAWGWKTWNESERERLDAEKCEVLRLFANNPKLSCARFRKRVGPVAAPARPVITAQDLVAP
jgi:hypothetical protein